MTRDEAVTKRKNKLISEACVTLDAIRAIAAHDVSNPLADPETLSNSVLIGVMDAPQLKNNPFGQGRIQTSIIDGACDSVDEKGCPLSEIRRLEHIFIKKKARAI